MIFSDKDLSQKIERTEATGNAKFVEARKRIFPNSEAEWIEVGGAYAMFDGIESPLTQTFGLGVFEEVTETELEQLEEFFNKHNAPVFHEISPMADVSLLNLLNERGYQPIELTNVMYLPLEGENKPKLPINPEITVRITEKGEEELWAQTSAEGWGTEMEGLADFMFELGQISASTEGGFPFLAEIDGKPISAGMLFIYDNAAILAGASTVPAERKQGGQTALLDARLRFAAEKGCTMAIMAALPGSQSQKNAQKNGFLIAYTRTKWQLKVQEK